MRMKFVFAFAAAAAAISQPAFAFGPAAMGRDLMYTASIGRGTGAEIVRAGFVRPNMPHMLAEIDGLQAHGATINDYSQPLTTVVGLVFESVLAKTADAIKVGVALGAIR